MTRQTIQTIYKKEHKITEITCSNTQIMASTMQDYTENLKYGPRVSLG